MSFLSTIKTPASGSVGTQPVKKGGSFLSGVTVGAVPTNSTPPVVNAPVSTMDRVKALTPTGSPLESLVNFNKENPKLPATTKNLNGFLEKAGGVVADTLTDTKDRISKAIDTFKSPTSSTLDKVTDIGSAGLGVINSAFSPVSGTLKGAESIPYIGQAAHVVNNIFGAVGAGASNVAGKVVDGSPLSEETKATIKPLVEELSALASQVALGKAGEIAVKRTAEIKSQIADRVKNDPVSTPATVENPTTTSFLKDVKTPESVIVPQAKVDTSIPAVEIAKVDTPMEQKPSKVGLSIEAKSIEQKLTDGFGDTAGYDPITIKDQAQRAADLMNRDMELARDMIKGKVPVENGLRGEMLIKAMEDHAQKTGDVQLLRDIANSPLVSDTSAHAQAMRILAERNPESPVAIMGDIKKIREGRAQTKTGKTITQSKKEIVKQIKDTIKQKVATKEDWSSFIKSLEC